MENPFHTEHSTRYGMVGGTLLTILININIHDVFKTAALAAIGAVVSFFCFTGFEAGCKICEKPVSAEVVIYSEDLVKGRFDATLFLCTTPKRAMHKADGGLMDNTRYTSLTTTDKRKCQQWACNKPCACGNAY